MPVSQSNVQPVRLSEDTAAMFPELQAAENTLHAAVKADSLSSAWQ